MRKFWILAAAAALANAAIDEAGLNACINKGDAASYKTLAAPKSYSGGARRHATLPRSFTPKG